MEISSVDDAMSSGVAWDDLGPLKAEARQMKYNKSSWARSLRSAAAAHDVVRDTAAAHDGLRDTAAARDGLRDTAAAHDVIRDAAAAAEGVDWRTAVALVPPAGQFMLEQKSLRHPMLLEEALPCCATMSEQPRLAARMAAVCTQQL